MTATNKQAIRERLSNFQLMERLLTLVQNWWFLTFQPSPQHVASKITH